MGTELVTKICRSCSYSFQELEEYNELGARVSFSSKYCPECNKKPKFTGNNGSWGTVNIESAKIPQRNVEGLEESLQTLATSIVNARDEFGAFKKHAEHDIEQNKQKLENFLEIQIGVNDKVNERIADNKLNFDVFKASQNNFNEDQVGINFSHLVLIKEIHRTLIIGFSVFVFFMLVTWGYLTYTHFNH